MNARHPRHRRLASRKGRKPLCGVYYGQSGGPTIASDEDMDWGYVLADEHAPDYETARELLRRLGSEQWSISLGSVLDHDPRRRSYKWVRDEHGEDNLMPCEPDDPDHDSDWWVFDLSMNDHDLIDPVRANG